MPTIQNFKVASAIAIICIYGELAKADTKHIKDIWIRDQDITRNETITLENDKELVVRGYLSQWLSLPNGEEKETKSKIFFVADKNGYRAKYTLETPKTHGFDAENLFIRFGTQTLKSLAG